MTSGNHALFLVSVGALVAFGLAGGPLGLFVSFEVIGVTALAL